MLRSWRAFASCAVFGIILGLSGCNASVDELGPAKETPKADKAEVDKKIQESMMKNKIKTPNQPGTP